MGLARLRCPGIYLANIKWKLFASANGRPFFKTNELGTKAKIFKLGTKWCPDEESNYFYVRQILRSTRSSNF